MSEGRKTRRLLPIGAVALAVGGAALIAAPGSAAAAPAAKGADRDCVTVDQVDRITKWSANEPVSSPVNVPVGFMTTWFGQIQDSADPTRISGANGVLDITAVDAATGNRTAYMSELIQYSDGAITFAGSYNRASALAGQWITMRVKGVSDAYSGLVGTIHWRITSTTDPAIPVQEHIVLCPLDPRS